MFLVKSLLKGKDGMRADASRTRNIAGTALMIIGLSILLWLVSSELKSPDSDAKQTKLTEQVETIADEGEEAPEQAEEVLLLGTFPESVQLASTEIQKAYKFASSRENHKVLEYQTCYCGCDMNPELKHESLLDCYFKKILPEDQVVYEEHAMVCSMCLNEAWDTEELVNQGQSKEQIKELIDSKYGRF